MSSPYPLFTILPADHSPLAGPPPRQPDPSESSPPTAHHWRARRHANLTHPPRLPLTVTTGGPVATRPSSCRQPAAAVQS
eukprot:3291725-Rhodomonas_salina.1